MLGSKYGKRKAIKELDLPHSPISDSVHQLLTSQTWCYLSLYNENRTLKVFLQLLITGVQRQRVSVPLRTICIPKTWVTSEWLWIED